jgi:hypothetical protein
MKGVAYCVVGLPVAYFILGPFPGMGCGFPIVDALQGHPARKHGTHPKDFLGLWIKEEPVEFGHVANSLYFLANGEFARTNGTLRRTWHYDEEVLYLDHVSGCGNCYRGVVTEKVTVYRQGNTRMRLVPWKDQGYSREIEGWYRRTDVTRELYEKMAIQSETSDYALSSQGRSVIDAIEHAGDLETK